MIQLSSEAQEELVKCFRCGYCRAWCPVFDIKRSESWSPRGRISMIRAITCGAEATNSVLERIYSCSLRKACEIDCPPRVKFSVLMGDIRSSLAKLSLGPLNDQRSLVAEIVRSGNIFGKEFRAPPNVQRLAEERAEIVLFMGCMASFRYSKHVECLGLLLRRAGVRFSLLPQESCYSSPLELFGVKAGFEEAVSTCLKLIEKARAESVLTFCPMCYSILKRVCRELQVLHATQLIAEILDKLPFRKLNMAVYYHDPCHLARYEGVAEEPRLALQSAGIRLVESRRKHCCGGPIRIPFIEPMLQAF